MSRIPKSSRPRPRSDAPDVDRLLRAINIAARLGLDDLLADLMEHHSLMQRAMEVEAQCALAEAKAEFGLLDQELASADLAKRLHFLAGGVVA